MRKNWACEVEFSHGPNGVCEPMKLAHLAHAFCPSHAPISDGTRLFLGMQLSAPGTHPPNQQKRLILISRNTSPVFGRSRVDHFLIPVPFPVPPAPGNASLSFHRVRSKTNRVKIYSIQRTGAALSLIIGNVLRMQGEIRELYGRGCTVIYDCMTKRVSREHVQIRFLNRDQTPWADSFRLGPDLAAIVGFTSAASYFNVSVSPGSRFAMWWHGHT